MERNSMKNRFSVQIFETTPTKYIEKCHKCIFFNKWMPYALCSDAKTENSTVVLFSILMEDRLISAKNAIFQGTGEFVDVLKWRWEDYSG